MLPVEIERRARELRKKIAEAKPEYAPIKGTTYYVSADGDDNNDGLSPETAWKTLDGPYNNFDNIKSGDAILFRCGDIFSATYPRRYGLVMTPGVTYSSFGEGPKPELRGAVGNGVEFDWKKEGENLYSLDLGHILDVGNIFFDDGEESSVSHFETALLLIPSINASSVCDIFFAVLSFFKNLPLNSAIAYTS